MKEIMSRIEDAEFPTDPDDPSAHDIEDLKADLRELRGRKKGGSVKKKARKKKFGIYINGISFFTALEALWINYALASIWLRLWWLF